MSREELRYEIIQTRTSEQLKEFCRKRDLEVSETKAELVASKRKKYRVKSVTNVDINMATTNVTQKESDVPSAKS